MIIGLLFGSFLQLQSATHTSFTLVVILQSHDVISKPRIIK